MKKILLAVTLASIASLSNAQVVFNEVYADPNAGHNEFFELYNTSTSSSALPLDDYTIVTYFESPGQRGFYVMDLPNLTIDPKGYFVGASDDPYSYQGVTNSTAADFSWNSAAFTSNNGYVKKWLLQSNGTYTEAALSPNFNDFFPKRTGVGATYTIFMYKNGVLISSLIFGTGGYSEVIPAIISMPPLFVDMSGASPDFTINFSGYASVPVETVNQDAGSDNGFYRERDGMCGGWNKSDNQGQHNPKVSNGYMDGYSGVISVTASITRGTAATGSKIVYDVLAAPSESFPVTLDVYRDYPTLTRLEATDVFFESNTEFMVTDGPFSSIFTPYDANLLVVVKSAAGCIDKVMFIPNASTLASNLTSFQLNRNDGNTALHWTEAQNELVKEFEIEKSFDGKNFTGIAIVAGSNKAGTDSYSFSESASGHERIFYRLRMTDKYETVAYSKIISFQLPSGSARSARVINPITDNLVISVDSPGEQKLEAAIFDMSGKLFPLGPVNVNAGTNLISLRLSSTLSAGTYVVRLGNKTDQYTAKFIKQ